MTELTIGTIIDGRYEVARVIGEGGFGIVVECVDRETGQRVAVKCLKFAADERRFAVESRALAKLDHPNCVKVFGTGVDRDLPYIAMEYVDGVSLRDWLSVPRSTSERLDVSLQLARALQHAHARGVIHRDFKPDNVLVARNGEAWVAYVVDFGLAKLSGIRQPDITKTGEVIGTPGFMSPEQLRGLSEVGPKTDLYCLGVVMFEVFEQVPPFQGNSALEVCIQHLQHDPPTMRNVDGKLARLVAALLDKAPERRPSATQVVNRIEAMLGLRPEPHVAGESSNTKYRFAGLAAIALLVAIVVVAASPGPEPPPPAPISRPSPPAVVWSAPPAADAADAAAAVDMGPGCGSSLAPGRQTFRRLRGLDQDELEAYVPTGYDPDIRHPLIIALHEGHQSPSAWLHEADIAQLADALGAVVVAPDGRVSLRGSWKIDSVQKIQSAKEIAALSTCIDPDRVALLGHGGGSRAGLEATCAGKFSGLVITNENFDPERKLCETAHATPVLHILVDNYTVPDGCLPMPDRHVEHHEALWRSRNGCSVAHTEEVLDHGVCRHWECDTRVTTCLAAGGLHWRDGFSDKCDGPASPFDYQGVVHRFLEPLLADPK